MQPTRSTMPPPRLGSPLPWNRVAQGYADQLQPFFSRYATDALALSGMAGGSRVLDVATGPGTLALLAHEAGCEVAAVDISRAMLETFRRTCNGRGISTICIGQADGHALPFMNETFDHAFSMFGLMFFPDRAAGFRELHRVVRPGGRVVVSTWAPTDDVPLLAAMGAALREFALPYGKGALPLSDPDELRRELGAGGFRSVEVHCVAHEVRIRSAAAFWASNERSSAPLALLRQEVGSGEWAVLSRRVVGHLEAELGPGPYSLRLHAYLGVGTR